MINDVPWGAYPKTYKKDNGKLPKEIVGQARMMVLGIKKKESPQSRNLNRGRGETYNLP